MPGDAPKAAGHNGWQQITPASREMGAGLKILVSAVQSRPSPPFISNSCPSANFLSTEVVPKLCLTPAHSSAFQRTTRLRTVGADTRHL
jgi:hypothetical protein